MKILCESEFVCAQLRYISESTARGWGEVSVFSKLTKAWEPNTKHIKDGLVFVVSED